MSSMNPIPNPYAGLNGAPGDQFAALQMRMSIVDNNRNTRLLIDAPGYFDIPDGGLAATIRIFLQPVAAIVPPATTPVLAYTTIPTSSQLNVLVVSSDSDLTLMVDQINDDGTTTTLTLKVRGTCLYSFPLQNIRVANRSSNLAKVIILAF